MEQEGLTASQVTACEQCESFRQLPGEVAILIRANATIVDGKAAPRILNEASLIILYIDIALSSGHLFPRSILALSAV